MSTLERCGVPTESSFTPGYHRNIEFIIVVLRGDYYCTGRSICAKCIRAKCRPCLESRPTYFWGVHTSFMSDDDYADDDGYDDEMAEFDAALEAKEEPAPAARLASPSQEDEYSKGLSALSCPYFPF